MIRLGNLDAWGRFDEGEAARFDGDRPRRVRVTVRTAHPTAIFLIVMGTPEAVAGEPLFLATIDGMDEIEFSAPGAFALQADGGTMWLRTADGETIHAEVPDAETFTRIAERRARNPEVERLQAMLMANQERRMGTLYAQIERRTRELERREAAVNSGAGAPRSDPATPEPTDSGGQSSQGAGTAPARTEGGDGAP